MYRQQKIGLLGVQLGVTPDKADNLARALRLIEEAADTYRQIDLICLPELYYTAPAPNERASAGEEKDSEFLRRLSSIARGHHVNIVTGTYPMRSGFGIKNTLFCLDRDGACIGEYSKTHLFDAYDSRESDLYDRGGSLGIFDFDFGRVGTAICYELRFPEYLRTIALRDTDLLVVPAAFYRPRSGDWDTLIRSAALGSNQYVLAVNQYGSRFFGHSAVVDPAGTVIAQASDREGTVYALIDPAYQEEVRKRTAISDNRRPDLYDVT